MTTTTIRSLALASACAIMAVAGPALAQTTLTIESWRNDDLPIWNEQIIPAFEKAHPDIKVVFQPTAPTEYNAALNSKLDAGTAGDIIACRPFDASLELFKKGQLSSVNDIPGVDKFGDVAKAGWSTDDGKTTFCVPVASVIHGFIYNKDAFDKVGAKVPETEDEFFAAARQAQGRRHLHPDGPRHQGPVGSRHHGLPEHRPELLEGRGGPSRAHRRQGEADRSRNGSSPTRRSPNGRPIWATASRRRPIPTARTCSRSAAPRSTRPAPGTSPSSTRRPSSRWAPSRRR